MSSPAGGWGWYPVITKTPNRAVGIVLGAGYLMLGILGFTATAGVDFVDSEGGQLFGLLEVNPLQNIIHGLVGAALLVGGLTSLRISRAVNPTLGAALLVFGLAGLFLIDTTINVVALNVADNVVHFASAALLLAVGLGADQVPPTLRVT